MHGSALREGLNHGAVQRHRQLKGRKLHSLAVGRGSAVHEIQSVQAVIPEGEEPEKGISVYEPAQISVKSKLRIHETDLNESSKGLET